MGIEDYSFLFRREATEPNKIEGPDIPTWTNDVIALAEASITSTDSAHDILHVIRVIRSAIIIGRKEGGNLAVLIPASAMHDLAVFQKDLILAGKESQHSAEYAGYILPEIPSFPPELIPDVQSAVSESSSDKVLGNKGKVPSTLEGKILYDTDKLDQTGDLMLMRYFASAGQWNRPHFDPHDIFGQKKLAAGRGLEEFNFTFEAIKKRRKMFEGKFFTKTAEEIAQRRNQSIDKFFHEIEIELREEVNLQAVPGLESTGAWAVMRLFYEAGKQAKPFYDARDPFCENHPPRPNAYPVDGLIKLSRELPRGLTAEIADRRQKFIQEFLEELKLELQGK